MTRHEGKRMREQDTMRYMRGWQRIVRIVSMVVSIGTPFVAVAEDVPFPRDYPVIQSQQGRRLPPLSSRALMYEAEDGDFFGVRQEKDYQGYTGSGYVKFPVIEGVSLAVTVTVPQEGYYALCLRSMVKPGDTSLAQVQIDVEERSVGAQRLPVTGIFSDVLCYYPLWLSKGENRLFISSLQGEWYLDRLTLEPLTKELYQTMLPRKNLATPSPLPAAQAVYQYLLDMQGKGILSGQQIYGRSVEINTIFKEIGKYPAILGIDLIDYSPSRVERGTKSSVIQEAINYWKKGGLVTCAWHWNAPTGLIDKEPDKRWYSGFYTKATTFDFAAALENPKGRDYALLLRDIDAIAAELKKLQTVGVPVLWRPLHEASGGWFWWGAKGPEPYKKLYMLLFDRLVRHHGLTNLIWVWNGQDPAWYPGDDVVDIISVDLYPPERDYRDHEKELRALQASAFEPKLCAISENGTLPNVEAIAQKKLPWAWFCTWNGEFVIDGSGKFSERYTERRVFKAYYEHPWLITRDEVPSLGRDIQ